MNTQMLKGLVDYIILKILYSHQYYGYQILNEIRKLEVEISDSTLYIALDRFYKKEMLDKFLEDSPIGPKRKVYFITKNGKEELKRLEKDYLILVEFIKKVSLLK
ncbi:TPA: PadR family transcriptional regulator [Staphylococcus aureus]